MTYRQAACRGVVGGSAFAAAVAAVLAARSAITITRAHRWYQLKQL